MLKCLMIISSLMTIIFFSTCTPKIVFAYSENWVEVARFEGSGMDFGLLESFRIEHSEWKIVWINIPYVSNPLGFTFYVIPHEDVSDNVFFSIRNRIGTATSFEQENGTINFEDKTGIFHLYVRPSESNWEIIIKENTYSSGPPEPNWVGWSTGSGSADFDGTPRIYTGTNSVTSRFNEWRIKWEYEKNDFVLTTFYCEIRLADTDEVIGSFSTNSSDRTEGIYNITGYDGTFTIFIETNTPKYFYEIERNVNSIPEFPSWVILPLVLTITLFLVVVKRKLYSNVKF